MIIKEPDHMLEPEKLETVSLVKWGLPKRVLILAMLSLHCNELKQNNKVAFQKTEICRWNEWAALRSKKIPTIARFNIS